MSPEEFALSMERLRGVYGERYYPTPRVTAFWEELRSTDSALWQAAIQRVILDEAQPPMMKQIRVALSQAREARGAGERNRIALAADDNIPPEVAKANVFKIRELLKKIGGGG